MNIENVVKTRLRRVSCSSPRSGWSRIQVDVLRTWCPPEILTVPSAIGERKFFTNFGDRLFDKVLFRARLGNSSKLGMLTCTSRKMLFLSVQADDVKLAGKKRNIDPMWKVLKKVVDLDERTSFLDHVYGLHSTGMRHQQRYWGQLQKYVCIQDLCRSKSKSILFREAWRRHLLSVFLIWKVVQRNV